MYACMHMHMHMYMHMYVYVYVYVCICIRWYVKAFVCTILQAGWNPLTGSAVQEHWRSFQGCPCILTFETSWFDLTLGSKVLAQEWRGTSKWPLLMQNMSNAHIFWIVATPASQLKQDGKMWSNIMRFFLCISYIHVRTVERVNMEKHHVSLSLSLCFPFSI